VKRDSVVRHTIMNLAGMGLPLVAAIFTIPVLIRHLGNERFGLLTLIWAVIGYFGLFDLGLGRALTQQLSVLIAHKEDSRIGGVITTSLLVMGGLGVVAGIALWLAAPPLVSVIKGVSDRQDAIAAVRAMALAIPFVVLTSGLRGILEARFAFAALNLIRVPIGLFTLLGPVAVVIWWSNRLAPLAMILTVARVIGCGAHVFFASPDLFKGRFDRRNLKPLLTSGGWMTVSNVISPLMGYVDGFIIGAVLSAGVVAYYTTPNEIITKIWIIPGALTAVLFPRFAQDIVRDSARSWSLFKRAVIAVFLVTLPIALALALFSSEILSLWLGKPFAAQSAPLLRLFAIGILMNCLAHVPYTLLQSANRARVTALIHCGIFPAFIALLWTLTRRFGVTGAAVSWLLRMGVDAGLMFYFGIRVIRRPLGPRIDTKLALAALVSIALFAAAFPHQLWMRAIVMCVGIAFAAYGAAVFLKPSGRTIWGES
jgi:O-antigen/teichoic acid export membrane protein